MSRMGHAVLALLDRLGCKSNGRTHFLLGKPLLVARTASMAPYSGVAGTQGWWRRGAVAVAGQGWWRRGAVAVAGSPEM